jgi:ribosome-binding factor A
MSKISQLNELIMHELAVLVNREIDFPGALITISYVDCSPDLKQAKVGFSVLPDNLSGTALRKLQTSTGHLVGLLRDRLRLRRLPHFIWEFDATEKEAGKIEKIITDLGNSEDN